MPFTGRVCPSWVLHIQRHLPRRSTALTPALRATPLPIRERGFVAGVGGAWRAVAPTHEGRNASGGPSPPARYARPPPLPIRKEGGSAVARLRATTLVGGTARIAAPPPSSFRPPSRRPLCLCVSCSVPIRHFVARRLCISAATPVPYGTRSTPNWALYACHKVSITKRRVAASVGAGKVASAIWPGSAPTLAR